MSLVNVLLSRWPANDASASVAKLEWAIQEKLGQASAPSLSSKGQIPTFFRAKPKPGSIAALLDGAVRELGVQSRANLEVAHLEQLKRLLLEHCEEGPEGDGIGEGLPGGPNGGGADYEVQQKRITYPAFCEVATRFAEIYGDAALRFFAPSTFLKLQRGAASSISIAAFIDYVKLKDYRMYLRHRISSHDPDHDGFLTEADVEAFLVSLADEMQYDMPQAVFDRWRVIAPRKVWFFLGKNGRVRVRDLLVSPMLDDVINYDCGNGGSADNWFAPEKSQAIYEKFLELDVDGDGKLSPAELSRLRCSEIDTHGERPSSMTDIFLRRVFEVHVHGVSEATGLPAMDLRDFADFLLAWNSRGEAPSLKYFFKVLDLEHTGRLTAPVIAVFAKHVADLWVTQLQLWEYESLDVKDEIFDMVTPRNPDFITLADLSACGMGDIICGMLVDAQCYYEYDQRERLAQGDGDDNG